MNRITRGLVKVLFGGVVLGCATQLGACGKSTKKVEFSTPPLQASAGMASTDARGVVSLPFSVSVKNTGQQPMALLSSAYAVTSGGVTIAQGREDLRVKNAAPKVAPGKSSELPVVARVSGAQIIKTLKGDIGGTSVPYQANVYVMVDSPTTGPITLTKTEAGALMVPPTFECAVDGALFNDPQNAGKHYVRFAIKNRNAWPVNVHTIEVEVTINGQFTGTARARAEAQVAPGGVLDLAPMVDFAPPITPANAPAVGSQASFRIRGTAAADGPSGPITIIFECESAGVIHSAS